MSTFPQVRILRSVIQLCMDAYRNCYRTDPLWFHKLDLNVVPTLL